MHAIEHVFVSASGSLRGLHKFVELILKKHFVVGIENFMGLRGVPFTKLELKLSMKLPQNEFSKH